MVGRGKGGKGGLSTFHIPSTTEEEIATEHKQRPWVAYFVEHTLGQAIDEELGLHPPPNCLIVVVVVVIIVVGRGGGIASLWWRS